MHRLATRSRTNDGHRQRGQGLVEFTLITPLILLLTLIAVDFGRVYLGYINLQNMARVAANFAANNPEAWADNDTEVKERYQNQIAADAEATNCSSPGGSHRPRHLRMSTAMVSRMGSAITRPLG